MGKATVARKESRDRGLTFLALALFVTAAGTLFFWVDWFVGGHVATDADSCYLAFEASFVLADALMSLSMALAAFAILKRSPSALLYSFLAAGGILSLASLDTAYNLQHGKYGRLGDPAMGLELYINIHCLLLGVATLWYVWKRRDLLARGGERPQPERPVRASERALSKLLAAVLFLITVAAVLPWPGRERLDRCAAVFHQSFALADIMVAAAALLSTFATVSAAPGSLRLVLFTSGALGFLASMNALFYLEQRQWQAIGSLPGVTTIVATYAASIWIAWTAWRLRHLFLSPTPSPSR